MRKSGQTPDREEHDGRWSPASGAPPRTDRGRECGRGGPYASDALPLQEEPYREIFENDLTGDFIAAPDGSLLLYNPAFQQIFGFDDAEEALGKDVGELFADPSAWHGAVRRLDRQNDRLHRHELEARKRDGTPLHVVQTLVGSFDERGDLIRLKGYVFDDTESRRMANRLHASELREAAETEALARLSAASLHLWHIKDLDEGLDAMLAAAIELLGAEKGHLQILDAARGVLVIAAQRGFDQDFLDRFHEVSPHESSAGARALRSGRQTVIEDVELDEEFTPLRPVARAAGYRAVQSTPLLGRDGTLLGMLSTHFSEPNRPSEHDLRLLELYARQAASFLEHLRDTDRLRRSEERLRLFIRYAPTAIAMLDRQMCYVAASQRWLADYGLIGRNLYGRSHYEILPEIPERWKQIYRRCLEEEVAHCDEDRLVRADGSVHWLRWEVRPWRTANDAVGGIVIFTEDITAPKRAAEAQRRSEQQLRLALEASGAATWGWNIPENRVDEWGPRYRELYGFSPEEPATYATWLARIHPDDRQRLLDRSERMIRTPGNDEWQEEFRIQHPQFGTRWVSVIGKCFRDDAGNAQYMTGVNLDITDRKRHEDDLRRLNESLEQRVAEQTGEIRLLAQAVSNLGEGVVITTATPDWLESEIVFVNEAMCRISGYGRDELIGRSPLLLHGREPDGHTTARMRSLLSAGREYRNEAVHRRKDATPYDVELLVAPLLDQRGHCANFVSIHRDISARRQAEHQLRQRELELAHAQRVLTLGELAAGLAHELAQPLSALTNEVGACVRFVRSGQADTPRLRASLEDAAEAADRAGQVLQQLRQMVEKRPAEFQRLDLREVVGSAVDLVRKTAEHRNIRLHLDLEQFALPVNADRVQLAQVLVNLLQNAIEAIEAADGARREIRVGCRSVAPETAEVTVQDSGTGLGGIEESSLFEPFFTTKTQGLGLGLAISRRIIDVHDGIIEADRAPADCGAIVRFTLPLLPREDDVAPART